MEGNYVSETKGKNGKMSFYTPNESHFKRTLPEMRKVLKKCFHKKIFNQSNDSNPSKCENTRKSRTKSSTFYVKENDSLIKSSDNESSDDDDEDFPLYENETVFCGIESLMISPDFSTGKERSGSIITWSTLKSLLETSHSTKDEFMKRECLEKGYDMISIDNLFDAIHMMESYGIDQCWCNKIVEIILSHFYITKSDNWSNAIVYCPKVMSFVQHFLLQKTAGQTLRVPERKNCIKRKKKLDLFVENNENSES